ncbi:MAG: 50S ribosomal protein L11 methyltransferase [Ilumatobacteraceae bacterium]
MRAIAVRVPTADAELAADRLWVAGASAVEELAIDGASVELRTVLGSDDAVARRRLGTVPSSWRVVFVDVDDTPAESWRAFAEPIVVGRRLEITPAWLAPAPRPGVLSIAIEPAGSFGLGDHPTTRLSAGAVDRLTMAGDRVLDVGCGSGVLSIVAACRGAARIVAIDVSEAAREATVANAAANGVLDRVEASTTPIGEIVGNFELVVANILAPTLVAMADHLVRLTAPDGHLVISGVLSGRYDHVVDALAPMRVVSEEHLDGWSAVVLRPQHGADLG